MNVTENDNECIIDRGDIKCVIDKHTGKVLNLDEILDKFDYNLEDVKIDINAPVGFDEIFADIDERRVLGFLLECYNSYKQKECVKKYNALKHQMEREREEFYIVKDDVEQQAEKKLQSVIQVQSSVIKELTDQLRRYQDIPPELLNATGDDLRDFYRYMLTITREINDVFTLVLKLNQFINGVIVPTIDGDIDILQDRIKEFEEMRDHAIKLTEKLRNKIHARKGRKLYELVHEQYELMVDKIIGAIMTNAVLVQTLCILKHGDQVNSTQVIRMREELSRQISDTLERMKSFSERNLDEDLEKEKIYAIHQLVAIVYRIIGKREEVDEEGEGNTTRTQETPSLFELTEHLEGYYTDREGMIGQTFDLLKGIIKTVTSLRPETEGEVRVEGDGLNGIHGTLISLQRSLQSFLNDGYANPQALREKLKRCRESLQALRGVTDGELEVYRQYMDRQDNEINELKARLEESRGMVAEIREAYNALQTELQNAQAHCDVLSEERDNLTSQLQKLSDELEAIRVNLEAAKDLNAALTEENDDLNARLRKLEGKKSRLKRKLQNKIEEIDRSNDQAQELERIIEEIRLELGATTIVNGLLTDENKDLKEQLRTLEDEKERLRAELQDKGEEIGECDARVQELEGEIELRNIQITELTEEKKTLEERIKMLEAGNARLQKELQEKDDAIVQLKERVQHLDEELEETKIKLRMEKEHTAVLTEEKKTLEERIKMLEADNARLQKELQGKDNDIDKVTDEMRKLYIAFTLRNNEIEESKKLRDELTLKLVAAQGSVHDLQEKQTELEHQNQVLHELNETFAQKITELQENNLRNEEANTQSNKTLIKILQELLNKCALLSDSLEGKEVVFEYTGPDENGQNEMIRPQILLIKQIYSLIEEYKNKANNTIRQLKNRLTEAEQEYKSEIDTMTKKIEDDEININRLLSILKTIAAHSRSLSSNIIRLQRSTNTSISDDKDIDISDIPMSEIIDESTRSFNVVLKKVEELMKDYNKLISTSAKEEIEQKEFMEKVKGNFALMRKFCVDLLQYDKVANEKNIDNIKQMIEKLRKEQADIGVTAQSLPVFPEWDSKEAFLKKLEELGLSDNLDITEDMSDKFNEVKHFCEESQKKYLDMKKQLMDAYVQYVANIMMLSRNNLLQTINTLKQEEYELKQQLDKELKKGKKSDQEIQELKDKLKKCHKANEKLPELEKKLEEMIEAYEQRVTESRNVIAKLKEQLTEYEQTIKKMEDTKVSLESEKQEHRLEIARLKAEIEKQHKTESDLNARNQELQETLYTLEKSFQNGSTENEKLNAKVTKLLHQIETLEKKAEESKQASNELQSQLNEKEKKLKSIESDNAELLGLNKRVKRERDQLERDLQALQKESGDSKVSYDSMINDLKALISSNESILTEMEGKNQNLQREPNDNHGEKKKISDMNGEQAAMIATIKQMIVAQKEALRKCRKENETITKKALQTQENDSTRIALLTEENVKLSQIISDQKESIDKQLKGIDDLTVSLEQSEKNSTDFQVTIQELQKKMANLETETQTLQTLNTSYKQNIDELQESIKKQTQEIESREKRLSELSIDAANIQELREELQKEKERLMEAAKTLEEQKPSICQSDNYRQLFAELLAEINKVKGLTYSIDPSTVSGTSTELIDGIRSIAQFYEEQFNALEAKMYIPDKIIELLKGFTIVPLEIEEVKATNNFDRKVTDYEQCGNVSKRLTLGIKRIIDLQVAVSAELNRIKYSYEYNKDPEKVRYKNFLDALVHFCTQLGYYNNDMKFVSAAALRDSTALARILKSTHNNARPLTAKTCEELVESLKVSIRNQEEQYKMELANLHSSTEPYKTFVIELLNAINTSDVTPSMHMRAKLRAVIARIPDGFDQNSFRRMSEYFMSMSMNCSWDRCNVMIGEFNRIMRGCGVNIPIRVPNPSHIFKKKAVDPPKLPQTMGIAFESLGLNPLMSNEHIFRDNDTLLFYAMCLCKNKMLIRMLLGDAFKKHFVEKEDTESFDKLLQTRMEMKPLILNMSVYNRLEEDGLDEFLETNFMKQLLLCIPEQEFITFCNTVFRVVSKTETRKSPIRIQKIIDGVASVKVKPRTMRNPSPEGPMLIHHNMRTSDDVLTRPDTFRPINIDVSVCNSASNLSKNSIAIFDVTRCLDTLFNDRSKEFTDLQKLTSSRVLPVKPEGSQSPAESIKGEFYGKECMFDISDPCDVKISLQPNDKCEIIMESMMKKSNDVIKIFGKNVGGNIVLIPFVDYITAINLGLQHVRLGTLDVKKCDIATFIARRNTLFLTIILGIVTHLIRSNYNIENVEPLLSVRDILQSEDERTIHLETRDILIQDFLSPKTDDTLSPKTDDTLSFAKYDNGNGYIQINTSICGKMEQSWNIMNAIASDSLRSSICSREYYRALSEQSKTYGRKMTAFTAQGIMPIPMIEFGSVPLQPWNCEEAVAKSSTPCCTVASVFFPQAHEYKALFRVGKFLEYTLQNIHNTKELEGIVLNLLKELEFPAHLEAERLSGREAIIKIDTKQFDASYRKFIGLFTVERSDTFKELLEKNKEAFRQTCVDLEDKEHPVEEKKEAPAPKVTPKVTPTSTASKSAPKVTPTSTAKTPTSTPKVTPTSTAKTPTSTPKVTPTSTASKSASKSAPKVTPTSTAKTPTSTAKTPTSTVKTGTSTKKTGGQQSLTGSALTSSGNGYLWLIFIVALILVLAVFVYMLAKNYTTTREQFTPSPPISKNMAHAYIREAPLNYYFPVNHH